jgi:DNA-3-methyladenine glycosylase I
MDNPKTYCDAVLSLDESNVHRHYHDTAYGFPIHHDAELFGRLILEINQAGLSWTTILNKEANFRQAYEEFDIRKIAAYGETDRNRLLQDAGIIRNRLKIDAAIYNAQVVLRLQEECGSFEQWLDQHHPKTLLEWMKLFKATFRFTGGEIVHEFLMSTGYLPGGHTKDCRIYQSVLAAKPAWNRPIKSQK